MLPGQGPTNPDFCVREGASPAFDGCLDGDDNCVVRCLLVRVVSGGVIAPFLAFAAALAPLHAHEPDAGHSPAVVHSHFEPHHLESHHTDGTEVEDGAEHVVWLDSPIAHALPFQLHPPAVPVGDRFEQAPLQSGWSVIACLDAAPAHGPPRCTSFLRGPPSLLA